MYMAHNFYKVFMPEEILKNQAAAFETASQNIDEVEQSHLTSTILNTVPSFLEP